MRDFEQDRKICEAATPAPWRVDSHGEIFQTKHITRDVWHIPRTQEDTTFIASAREGWPAALDEVKRLSENINAYAFESGRVSLKCQDQSKEIESLKRQLEMAAETMPDCPNCTVSEELSFCTVDIEGDCEKSYQECWLEYWRQKAGEGAK